MEPINILLLILISVVTLVCGFLFSELMKLRHDIRVLRKTLQEGAEARVFRMDSVYPKKVDYVGKYILKFKNILNEGN